MDARDTLLRHACVYGCRCACFHSYGIIWFLLGTPPVLVQLLLPCCRKKSSDFCTQSLFVCWWGSLEFGFEIQSINRRDTVGRCPRIPATHWWRQCPSLRMRGRLFFSYGILLFSAGRPSRIGSASTGVSPRDILACLHTGAFRLRARLSAFSLRRHLCHLLLLRVACSL